MDPLSPEAATSVLRRHLTPGLRCAAVERGPIGNGQETWFLDVEDGPSHRRSLVLRRTADAGPLEWTDRAAEARAMAAAAEHGLPVPQVHVLGADDAELGAPYMVMDRAEGTSAMRAEGEERVDLARDLARHLARLHAAAIVDPLQRDAIQATRDEVERWRRHYLDNRVTAVPLIDALLAWCSSNVPDFGDDPAILLWGDAGAHNVLGSDGAVTAMLDWELAHPGHPMEDLASAIWIDQEAGVDPQVLIGAYEEAAGCVVDTDVIRFFLVMMCVTRSLMITVGAGAFVRGRTAAPNLAGLGLDLPAANLAQAAAHAGWGASPEPITPPPATTAADVLRPTGDEIDVGIARFLRDDVLPVVDDPRTRRGLKTAAALLETAALRARSERAVTEIRRRRTADLLADLATRGVAGDLVAAAVRVETDPTLVDLRPRVRDHLLTDLAHQRGLLTPLHRLYHR